MATHWDTQTGTIQAGPLPFGGETFERDRDGARLHGELEAVYRAVSDGDWWTLADLAKRVGKPEASVSARLRDLRKSSFGAHRIERMHLAGGVWAYRLR